jgi:hypothetical protein
MPVSVKSAAWKVSYEDHPVSKWLSQHHLDEGWEKNIEIETEGGAIIVRHLADEVPREVFVKERQEHILVDALKAIEALNRL